MATTITAFEAEILAMFPNPGSRDRGLMAGAACRLKDAYARGMVDPAAHTFAKSNSRQVDALTRNSELASFDAITGP